MRTKHINNENRSHIQSSVAKKEVPPAYEYFTTWHQFLLQEIQAHWTVSPETS